MVPISLSDPEQLNPISSEIKHRYRMVEFYLSGEVNVKDQWNAVALRVSVIIIEIY